MSKIYIIILNPDAQNAEIISRIKSNKDSIRIFSNCWCMVSDQKAHDLYNSLTDDNKAKSTILIQEVTKGSDYWGYLSKSIWPWLRNAKSQISNE